MNFIVYANMAKCYGIKKQYFEKKKTLLSEQNGKKGRVNAKRLIFI